MASPAQHYAESERLLGATDETPATAALLAVAHALLAQPPRRARKLPGRHADGNGLPPRLSWGEQS